MSFNFDGICFLSYATAIAQADNLVAGRAIRMNGFVGEKLANASANRVFAQDVSRLVEPFKHRDDARCWQTEFRGKCFTSAVLAYRYQPMAASKAVLDKAVADLLKLMISDFHNRMCMVDYGGIG